MKKRFSNNSKVLFIAILGAGLLLAGVSRITTPSGSSSSGTETNKSSNSKKAQNEDQENSPSAQSAEDKYVKVGMEYCEEKNGVLVIKDSYCPCPKDPGVASICGLVSNSKIEGDRSTGYNKSKTIYSTRKPIAGVTVAIYENDPYAPTGKPFGNLEKKLVECQTSEKEGKYFCYTRRITPGTAAYVIFACTGKIADIKIISSARSITSLDSDVDCSGKQNHTHLPQVLDYANRDKFLGCLSSENGVPNKAVGYSVPQEIHFATNIGEVSDQPSHTGDIRFAPFEPVTAAGVGQVVGSHPGALVENDCLIEYRVGKDKLVRKYVQDVAVGSLGLTPEMIADYGSIYQKCNYNPSKSNAVEDSAMEDTDERTTPFRYDIPTSSTENEQFRVWESRTSLQRVNEWPFGPQQFLHVMFGECSMLTRMRYYQSDVNIDPIPCEYYKQCNTDYGDPLRNTSTSNSIAARLENPVTYQEMAKVQERDKDDVVCEDKNGNEIQLKDIQPPWDNSCAPGGVGCSYKLGKEYYAPQLFLAAQGARVDYKTESFNDAYGRNSNTGRGNAWELGKTEPDTPHLTGDYVNYEVAEKRKEQNSAISAIRIATEGSVTGLTTVPGVLANKLVSPADAEYGIYPYSYDHIIYDVGGNIQSLCTISSINGGPYAAPIVRNKVDEKNLLISNFFKGDAADHRTNESAGTATYATTFGRQRDSDMMVQYFWRDVFDSVQRYRVGSGGGDSSVPFGEAWAKIQAFVSSMSRGIPYKSYAQRADNWNEDTPSYMFVDYCISEEDFNTSFPAYGQAGYPGNADGCYNWKALDHKESCNSWPGARTDWPSNCSGTNLPAGYACPFTGLWPGIDNQLRTCKQTPEDECMVMWEQKHCETDSPNDTECDSITHSNKSRKCTLADRKTCLERQKDRYDDWLKRTEDGYGWDIIKDPPMPTIEDPTTSSSRLYACSLQKAGPMAAPGKLFKDHAARVTQEELHEQQIDADAMVDVMNYTVLSMTSPVEEKKYGELANFLDYAVTNDQGDGGGSNPACTSANNWCAIQGGGAGAVHKYTAGAQGRGLGVGNVVELLKIVSFPERPTIPTEKYPEIKPSDVFCNVNDRSPTNWCRLIPPPEKIIDLETISGGGCNVKVKSGSCPVNGVGDLAGRILGAAGQHAGVPGSILLAAIVGEGGWLDPATGYGRMMWDDKSIASYSEPWYARMPKCQEMVWSAQGPFGLLDHWFKLAVWGSSTYSGRPTMSGDPLVDASKGGGFHPLRINNEGGIVASKCNFIDAAYAAAWELRGAVGDIGCSASSAQIRQALAVYRGGASASPSDVPQFLVDIAVGCQ